MSLPDESAIFNEDEALIRTDGDSVLMREVVAFALEDLPLLLSRLSAALEAGDTKSVGALAHTVKGTAGAVGAGNLYRASLALEEAAKAGRLDTGGLLDSVSDALSRFVENPRVRELAAVVGLDGPDGRR